MIASGAQLLLTVASQRNVPVAYVTGLQMRRAAQLYAGTAKTGPIDPWVLADFARRNLDRLAWLEVNDELLVQLKVLNGRDTDLAIDANRTINRCRDVLVAVSPALERVIGDRLVYAGVRDLLSKWATPTSLKIAGKARIETRIKKRSPRLATKLTEEIWVAVQAQTVTLPAESTWGEVISGLASDLDRLQTQRDELASNEERYVPRSVRSYPTRPRRQGLLPTKTSRRQKHNAAIICVARRRCNLILAMLKTQTAYNPERNLQKAA